MVTGCGAIKLKPSQKWLASWMTVMELQHVMQVAKGEKSLTASSTSAATITSQQDVPTGTAVARVFGNSQQLSDWI